MPAGHTKFSVAWLSHIDANAQTLGEWCRKGKDDFHGYCRFCDAQIKCDNAGKQQLLQHAKKDKHKQAIKYLQDNKQGKLFFPATSTSTSNSTSSTPKLETINYSDASLVAEIYWLAKMAYCNFSMRSADHIGGIFQTMFPDSKIAANFSLNRTSSYMIGEGLAPYFKNIIVEDFTKSGNQICHFACISMKPAQHKSRNKWILLCDTGHPLTTRYGSPSTHHSFLDMPRETG